MDLNVLWFFEYKERQGQVVFVCLFAFWTEIILKLTFQKLATGGFYHEDYTHHKETQSVPIVRQTLASKIQSEMCS